MWKSKTAVLCPLLYIHLYSFNICYRRPFLPTTEQMDCPFSSVQGHLFSHIFFPKCYNYKCSLSKLLHSLCLVCYLCQKTLLESFSSIIQLWKCLFFLNNFVWFVYSSRTIKTFELFSNTVVQFSINFLFSIYSKDLERRCASSLVYLLLEYWFLQSPYIFL